MTNSQPIGTSKLCIYEYWLICTMYGWDIYKTNSQNVETNHTFKKANLPYLASHFLFQSSTSGSAIIISRFPGSYILYCLNILIQPEILEAVLCQPSIGYGGPIYVIGTSAGNSKFCLIILYRQSICIMPFYCSNKSFTPVQSLYI